MKFKALICLMCLYYRISLAYSPRLLFVNRKDIRKVCTSSKNHNETIIVDGLDDAIAVDFHYTKGFIFWTDVNLEKIKRIRVSTGEVEDVVSVGLKKPEGLAVDWIAGKLYWTDCRDAEWETNRIEVANLDGSNRKVLFWKDLGLPRAIAVDPLLGYMFWTDWGEQPKIERAEMDSSNRRVIIRKNIHWPNGLTIDYSAQKIYWTDANLFYIDKANYDGSNRESIFRSPRQCILGHPFALTLYENKIYWTDWKTRGIHLTNKNKGLRCPVILSNTVSPMDIRAYESKRQMPRPGDNPCNSSANGGCSHLCLLNRHGHSCACPTGVKLLQDNRTCEQAKCSKDEVRCNGGKCISVTKLCDGNADCEDGSDEEQDNCPMKCADNEFPCLTVCISKESVCDNLDDCADGADERGCDVITEKCFEGEMRCDRGKCINVTKLCDGISDCEDLSDEEQDKCLPTKVKESSANVGLAVGISFGMLTLSTCLVVLGKLWYRRSRHAEKGNYRNITDEVIVNVPAVSLLEGVSRSKTTTV